LAIPTYTPPAAPAVTASERPSIRMGGASYPWLDHARGAASPLRATPRAVQIALDVAGITFALLVFAHTPVPPEVLFHVVFVVLTLHAFLFGLRGTLLRIAITSVPLLIDANAAALGLAQTSLELSEWPLMFVIAVLVAKMADQRKRTSRLYAARFRQASERLLTVQDDERRRIAGELHDGIGQILTALTLTLDAASSAPRREVVARRIRLARELSDRALAETRDLSHRMRPGRSEERGLVPSLRDLAKQSGFPVRIVTDATAADPRVLGPTATVEVYRIVQEALSNAARHSGATHAVVSLTAGDGALGVTVNDDGIGFTRGPEHELGIGLAGMQERAELLGGHLTIASHPGQGTRIGLGVPLGASPEVD
jgi:signal transduction histidine kinase